MARGKPPRGSTTGQRPSWRGQFTFGLVSFAVEDYSAVDREGSDIHFNMLHANCHQRIRYVKSCPIHDEVTSDEIVSGYEHKRGQYVEFTPQEIRSLKRENDQVLRIDAFVGFDAIDPLYFDGRMYFLAPGNAAAKEPYAVILQAMSSEMRVAVGRVVLSGKDQIGLIRPWQDVLHMAMLNYEAEVRSPEPFAKAARGVRGIDRQVRMARNLIEDWSEDSFDFSQYEDEHRDEIRRLIDAKVKGREWVQPEPEEEPPVVLNLMDAIKKSMGRGKKAQDRKRKRA